MQRSILFSILTLLTIASSDSQPAAAQGIQYGKRPQQTISRAAVGGNRSRPTNQQRISLRPTGMSSLGYAPQVSGMRNGLPPTMLDSFVLNAGAFAEHIYGDEATGRQPPPYMCFTEAHRINNGIRGERNIGLTTGHGSVLPDAWGRDEFLGMPESSQSGERVFDFEEIPFKNKLTKKYRDEQFPVGYQELDSEKWLDEDRPRTVPESADTSEFAESGFESDFRTGSGF
jgi:hypothetical protein